MIVAYSCRFNNLRTRTSSRVQSRVVIVIGVIARSVAIIVAGLAGRHYDSWLGTAFTMEQEFYKGRLSEKYGLDVQIPTEEDRKFVHETIYRDLCLEKTQANARTEFLRIIDGFAKLGARGVILGCTEIGMLVSLLDALYRAFVFSRIDESSIWVHK